MSFFLETKQHTEATTIKNLRLETGWKFTALLIKETECSINTDKIFYCNLKFIAGIGMQLEST